MFFVLFFPPPACVVVFSTSGVSVLHGLAFFVLCVCFFFVLGLKTGHNHFGEFIFLLLVSMVKEVYYFVSDHLVLCIVCIYFFPLHDLLTCV